MDNSLYVAQGKPHLNPSFSIRNRLGRIFWFFAYTLLFRFTPRPMHKWRALVLKCFGAKLGKGCHVYPGAIIWAPWNLRCGDHVGIASGANIYNPCPIFIDSYANISQESYLCGATHDYDDPDFPLIAKPIWIKSHAWVCARATVLLGVEVGEGAVLALGSVTSNNLEPWTVYGGIPAKKIKSRKHQEAYAQ